MPEVCEITITAQYLLSKLRDAYITKMTVLSGKYTHTSLNGRELIETHQPLKIVNIDSKGKFMWFELRDNKCNDIFIMNNFGLTGEWSIGDSADSRVTFELQSGETLNYEDQRNFGILQITDSRAVLDKKINKLAPDVLKSNFTANEFNAWVLDYVGKSRSRGKNIIVKVLLKQDKKDGIVSGIGNYLSAEILYRAKISPYRTMESLSHDEIIVLAKNIQYVVKLCYISNITGYMSKLKEFIPVHKQGVENGEFPNYHSNVSVSDTFKFLVYRRKTDDLGNEVVGDKIVEGRTTYWVPAVQV